MPQFDGMSTALQGGQSQDQRKVVLCYPKKINGSRVLPIRASARLAERVTLGKSDLFMGQAIRRTIPRFGIPRRSQQPKVRIKQLTAIGKTIR